MGHAKGAVLVGPIKFLRKNRERALELLPLAMHRYLEEDVRLSSWYPETDFVELIRAAARIAPGDPDENIQHMGAIGAAGHLEMYGDLMRSLPSTSSLFALWTAQHDTGRLRAIFESPTSARVELAEFDSAAREICLLCTGYIRGALRANGYEDLDVEKRRCVLRGDPLCEWRMTWKGRES
jgi:hypothetical protein